MTKLSTRSLVRVGITTLALTLAACGGGGGSDGTDAADSATAALSQATDCGGLLESIRADAREKIRVQADELRAKGWSYSGAGRPSPVATASPAPTLTPAPPGAPPPRDAIDPNTRIPGVDEADVVDTDGTRLYVLHENELLVLPVTPPEALHVAERLPIEGAPIGTVIGDGRGVALSYVSDDGRLGGDSRCDRIGPPFPRPGFRPCGSRFLKTTVLDSSASPTRVARELYIEGDYVGARRHDGRARVIVQRSWGVPSNVGDPWSALRSSSAFVNEDVFRRRVDDWKANALAAIEASTLDQWLPALRERVGSTFTEHPLACADVRVPPLGEAQHGATVIVDIDLAAVTAPIDVTTVLGAGSQVYADEETLVLAFPGWQPRPYGESATRTTLHVFALSTDRGATTYRGSGFVPGDVLSRFALDARNESVRVATQFARQLDGRNVTRVHVTHIEDDALAIVGATDIASGTPSHGARFFGAHAYIDSIFEADPLVVVDLADPRRPTVVGEIAIPGFSEYLRPIDADHLLTISQEQFGDVALKLFEVEDPAAPRLVADEDLPEDSRAPAQWDHLAHTFDARHGLLALPLNVRFLDGSVATLQLYEIDPLVGIVPRGRVQHELPRSVPCVPPFEHRMCLTLETARRGVFIDDVVYSITDREVLARRASDPSLHVARVPLP